MKRDNVQELLEDLKQEFPISRIPIDEVERVRWALGRRILYELENALQDDREEGE